MSFSSIRDIKAIMGSPIKAVGSSDFIYLKREIPRASDLKLPAQLIGLSKST